MRYELYIRTLENKKYEYYYRFSSNNMNDIFINMENNPSPKTSKYIIIDNNTQNPVNHFQLGLKDLPSTKKHYEIIYDCKISKVCYEHITSQNANNENYIDDWDNIFETIFKLAKEDTDLYFKNYNAKK